MPRAWHLGSGTQWQVWLADLNTAVSFPVVLYETKYALQHYLQAAGLRLTLRELHEAIASPDVKELVGLSLHDHSYRVDRLSTCARAPPSATDWFIIVGGLSSHKPSSQYSIA